ncbi:MAG: hypothetical protein K2Q26_12285 [Bdellovibrionales bacterium]|nr:hypothetical protein [Bdellovibrionales bacterium]
MNVGEKEKVDIELVSGHEGLGRKVYPEKPSDDPRDIPCVRLTADQVVEITADDYSLKIFNLTRIKPMTIIEITEKEPEPEVGSAEETIHRFIQVGLVEALENNSYFSKFPKNYVNFTDHPYDEEFESDKDIRIFKLMKTMAGDKEFWKTNAYFSEDGYFTEEQTMHIKKCLQDIKFYVKRVVQENNKKGETEGLTFRRHKFYDLTLPVFAFVVYILMAFSSQQSQAANDPGIIGDQKAQNASIAPLSVDQILESIAWSKSKYWQDYMSDSLIYSSNDPGRQIVARSIEQDVISAKQPAFFAGWNFEQPLPAKDSAWAFKCSNQLTKSKGDLNSVALPCLGDVKFATETVCGEYGDSEYCDVAARAAELLKIQLKK